MVEREDDAGYWQADELLNGLLERIYAAYDVGSGQVPPARVLANPTHPRAQRTSVIGTHTTLPTGDQYLCNRTESLHL